MALEAPIYATRAMRACDFGGEGSSRGEKVGVVAVREGEEGCVRCGCMIGGKGWDIVSMGGVTFRGLKSLDCSHDVLPREKGGC